MGDYLVDNKAVPTVNINASIQNTQMSNNSDLALTKTVKQPMNSIDFAIKAIEKNPTAIDIVNGTNLITDKSSNNFMKISNLTINSLSDKNNLLHAANYEDNINSTKMNAAVMANDFKGISSNKSSATANLEVNNFDIKSNTSEKMEDLFTTIATPTANGATLFGNVTWSSATNPIVKVIDETSVKILEGNTKYVAGVDNSSTKLEEEIVAISYSPTLENNNQTSSQLNPSEKGTGYNKLKFNNITNNAQYQHDSIYHNFNVSADNDVDMTAIHKISAMLDTTATLPISNVLNLSSIIEDLKQIETTTQINSNEQLQIPNIAVTDNISSTNGPTTDTMLSNKPVIQKNGTFYPVVRDEQQNHLEHVTTERTVTLPINSIAPTASIVVGSHIQYAKNNSESTELLSPVGNPLKLPVTYATIGIEQTNENGTLVTNTSVTPVTPDTPDTPSTTVISTTEKELEHLASLIEKYIMQETSNIESSEFIEQQQSTASANDKAAASKIHLKNDGNANINTTSAPSLSTVDKNNKNIIMTAAIKAENRNDTEKHNKTILKTLREEVTSTVNCYTNTDVTDLAAASDSAATIKDEKSSIETIKDNDTVGNDNVENDNSHTLQQEHKVDYIDPANVKEMPYKDINVQVHKKNSDSITRTSGKEMETNKMSTIENEKESIDISSEDNKQTYDTQNDKNQKNNDDNAFSNNPEQPNMSHDINQDDTEFGSGDDSDDSDDEDDNKKSYYTLTFDNTVARNSYGHLLSSAKNTETELPNISVNSAKNTNNKSFELKKNQNQFNTDNDTTTAQLHIESSSPISDSVATTPYSSGDKRIKSQAEIAPTNWWRTLPYAEIRKFLNTIFDSAAEELYEEIARKSKEIRKGHKLNNQEDSLDATLTHKTNSENGGYWSYLFSR
ncbi:putative uncharacterized protein DDB_G0282133 [Teleopsis dalmanni]|uniref:putative uncharacterized protein DDB_G0282133 n=1 Tax=Teleopsis dalmanni TaxID=139649 RepID=UPI0018CCA7B8|nr:putative uncharacterized protein DDB_G0282133 [Teleopsis dalmanni]